MPMQDQVQNTLWVMTALLELGIVCAIFRNGLHRKVPCFFAYVLFQVAREIFVAPLSFKLPVVYFYAYWFSEAASGLLGLAVIHEIYAQTLEQYGSLKKLGTLLFQWACVILVAVSLVLSFASQGSENIQLVSTIFATERSVRFLQAGLLGFLFMFARSFGLNWRHYIFGIALGLSVFVASELVVVTIRNYFGRGVDDAFVLLKPAAYLCAVGVWLVYLLKPVPSDLVITPSARELNHAYRWNQALEGYLR